MPREMTFGTNLVNDVAGGVGTAAFYILSFWRILKPIQKTDQFNAAPLQ